MKIHPLRGHRNRTSASISTHILRVVLGVAATALSFGPAHSADNDAWPSKPITLVVPFSPGGGADTLARLIATPLSQRIGQSIIVDNKPGAGGNIGSVYVAKAKPDGYTLIYGTNGTMAANHSLYKAPGYSPKDFEPIARFLTIALALTVGKDSPFKSVSELVTYAKANPDKLSCASGGNGTASHLACGMLKQMAGIEVTHVPYKSGQVAVVDLTTGRVSFMIDVVPNLTSSIKSGNIKALAVSTAKRIDALPDTPTISESGVPGYEIFAWDGLFAPKGTPVEHIERLHTAAQALLNNPEFRKTMLDRGSIPSPLSRKEFIDFTQREYQRLGDLVKKIGVTID